MKKYNFSFLILLVICLLGTTLIPGAFSQSQTANLRILSYSHYIDSIGYLVVVGEVQNDGPNTVDAIYLSGVVTTSDDAQSTSGINVWAGKIIQKQKAPFYMEFYSTTTSDGTWYGQEITDISLSIVKADATADYQYQDLTITETSSKISDGVYWVNGKIKNIGDQTAQDVSLVATYYNSAGKVVGVGYTDETTLNPTTLSPSGTATFKVGALDLNQSVVPSDMKISSYSLLIQVKSPILQGSPPVITETPTPNPTSSPTGTTTDFSAELIYALVIIVAVVAVAAIYLLLRKRSKSQPLSQNKNKPKKHKK